MAFLVAAIMQYGTVIDLTPGLAVLGSQLSIEFKLPMADSMILATARHYNAILWTQDADFEGISGVRYIPK